MTFMHTRTAAFLAAALLTGVTAQAATAPAPHAATLLLQAAPGDQVPGNLMAGEPADVDIEHAPVHVSWALPAQDTLKAAPQPFQRISRHFLIDADGSELAHGVAIPLTSRGAMLRISPRDRTSAPLNAGQVQIRQGGHRYAAASVSSAMAESHLMTRAGMALPAGSVAMRLDRRIAAGTVQLQASGARGGYVIQVNEPDSPLALSMAADHDTRLAGQPVTLQVRLDAPGAAAGLDTVSGLLVAPDGWTTDVDFAPRPDRRFAATVSPPAEHAGQRGLWEVHVFASGHDGQRQVLRDATDAFAAVRPTARLDGAMQRLPALSGDNLAFAIGIDAAAASRYALSGVLYGHAADGSLQPAVFAQSAAWLQPGHGDSIDLTFDADAIAQSGLQAPFELHDLRLQDQVQLGLLERRELAARGLPAHD